MLNLYLRSISAVSNIDVSVVLVGHLYAGHVQVCPCNPNLRKKPLGRCLLILLGHVMLATWWSFSGGFDGVPISTESDLADLLWSKSNTLCGILVCNQHPPNPRLHVDRHNPESPLIGWCQLHDYSPLNPHSWSFSCFTADFSANHPISVMFFFHIASIIWANIGSHMC